MQAIDIEKNPPDRNIEGSPQGIGCASNEKNLALYSRILADTIQGLRYGPVHRGAEITGLPFFRAWAWAHHLLYCRRAAMDCAGRTTADKA